MPTRFVCVRCHRPSMRNRGSHSGLCSPCYSEHHDECVSAIKAVRRAIRRGDLQPAKGQECADCGKDARDLDHRDYTKPLEVVPVCRSCNLKRGTAYDSKYRPS